MYSKSKLAIAALTLVGAGAASAGVTPYPNPGTANPDTYSFTATATGDLVGYFLGSGASFDEAVGVLINGQPSAVGLDDHSTAVGTSFDFGHVTAGDTLVFFDVISSTGNTFYTDVSKNADGVNHVYSTSFAGQGTIPAGTYIGFEDQLGGGDLNYFDDTFVFTNVSTTPAVPEPANVALLLAGLGLMGVVARRRGAK